MRFFSIIGLCFTVGLVTCPLATSAKPPTRKAQANQLLKQCFGSIPKIPRSATRRYNRFKKKSKRARDKAIRKIKITPELKEHIVRQTMMSCRLMDNKEDHNNAHSTRIRPIANRLLGLLSKPHKQQISFKISPSDAVNAFMTLGGHGCVFEGLLNTLKNNDGALAFVLAHEIAHHLLSHVDDRVKTQMAAENDQFREQEMERLQAQIEPLREFQRMVGVISKKDRRILKQVERQLKKVARAAKALFPEVTQQILKATAPWFARLIEAPYDQDDEYAADMLGLCLLTKAQYAPEGSVAFFETMTRSSGSQTKSSDVAEWLRTHPNPGARKTYMQKLLKKLRPSP